ncbi:MAG: hypothetical protein M3Q05_05200, partial [Bacteroidota bacterium]|nr:hypothetical protein [Bacteroidota bacterium]
MYKKIYYTFLVFWLLFAVFISPVWAQTAKDFATKYENAKQLITANKYQLAMAELQPIISANQANYSPGAMYLYAFAAVKAKKYTDASQKLNLLKNAYPTWPNLSDALFLEANLAFEQKEYDRALAALESIKEKDLEADIKAMEFNYLNQISDKAFMQNLVNKFPENKILGQVYAKKLMAGWYTAADKETLENLVKKFKLDKSKYGPENLTTVKKNNFNIAVLLPFPQNDAEAKARRNQFVTDLYAGMLLAQDSLAKQQIQLNLFTYDAPADTNKIKSTLQMPELASMDLIVGPVFKSANKIISRFSRDHDLN